MLWDLLLSVLVAGKEPGCATGPETDTILVRGVDFLLKVWGFTYFPLTNSLCAANTFSSPASPSSREYLPEPQPQTYAKVAAYFRKASLPSLKDTPSKTPCRKAAQSTPPFHSS